MTEIDDLYNADLYKFMSDQEKIEQLKEDIKYWYNESNTLRKLYNNCRERNVKLVKMINELKFRSETHHTEAK